MQDEYDDDDDDDGTMIMICIDKHRNEISPSSYLSFSAQLTALKRRLAAKPRLYTVYIAQHTWYDTQYRIIHRMLYINYHTSHIF